MPKAHADGTKDLSLGGREPFADMAGKKPNMADSNRGKTRLSTPGLALSENLNVWPDDLGMRMANSRQESPRTTCRDDHGHGSMVPPIV